MWSTSFDALTAMVRHKEKWKLKKVEELPGYLQDNLFLRKYHRPELKSVKECLRSMFMLHSETGNIWTHLIAAVIMAILFIRHLNTSESFQESLFFSLFFLGNIGCMTISSTYHTFICYSRQVCRFLAKMDYCGIISMTILSWSPFVYYCFCYCSFTVKVYFFFIIFVLFLGLTMVMREDFLRPQGHAKRISVFFSIGAVSFIFAGHFLLAEAMYDSKAAQVFAYCLPMGSLYFGGGFLYAIKFPERKFPGKCDLFVSNYFFHFSFISLLLNSFYLLDFE